MSPPRLQTPTQTDDREIRQLETIVLTQVRDNMALMNTNMTRITEQVARVNDSVTELRAQDFAGQIMRMEQRLKEDQEKLHVDLQRQITANEANIEKHEARINLQAVQIGRYGMGMTIAAVASGSALTAVIATLVPKLLGGH